jgi:hypothetical protein
VAEAQLGSGSLELEAAMSSRCLMPSRRLGLVEEFPCFSTVALIVLECRQQQEGIGDVPRVLGLFEARERQSGITAANN